MAWRESSTPPSISIAAIRESLYESTSGPSGIAIGQGPFVARIGQDGRVREMDAALAELVMAADMVEMGVAGDPNEGTLAEQRHMVAQAEIAKASVDEQVAIAAVHMPDVAAVEGLDSRLVEGLLGFRIPILAEA